MNYDILDSVLIYSTKYSVVIYVCRVLRHPPLTVNIRVQDVPDIPRF